MVKPCLRVATSLTGRPRRLAAMAVSAVRWVSEPFDPNAPPTNGLTDAHLFRIDAELLGEAVFQAVDELARLVHRQLVVVPDAGRREQLHRIVVLGRRRVLAVDRDRRCREGGLGVAERRVLVRLVDVGDSLDRRSRRPEGRRRRVFVVFDARSCAPPRSPPRTSRRRPSRRSARRARSSANSAARSNCRPARPSKRCSAAARHWRSGTSGCRGRRERRGRRRD